MKKTIHNLSKSDSYNFRLPYPYYYYTYNILSNTLSNITTVFTIFVLSFSLSLTAASLSSDDSNDKRNHNLNKEFTQELLLAEFAINNHNPMKALEIYTRIAKQSQDPQIAMRATELALENNQDQVAIEVATIWADLEPNSPKALLISSLLLTQYKDVKQAIPYIVRLMSLSSDEVPAYIELLIAHPLPNDKFTALQTGLENVTKEENLKNNANMNLLLALLYDKSNNGTKSLEYINTALKLAPKLQSAHINKIRLLNIYQSTDAAINYLDNTVAAFPDNDELRKLYADILFDLENWNKASEQYQKLSKSEVYQEESLMQLAYISISNNNIKKATKILKKLTNSSKYDNTANYYLGLIEQQNLNIKDALEYFTAIEDGEYFIRGKIRVASILLAQNKIESAQNAITSAIGTIDHQDTFSHTNAKEILLSEAELLYQQGLYNDAMVILNNAKQYYNDDQDVLYSIGILARKLQDNDLFIKNMQYILKNEPNNSNALSALGWHYYETDENQQAFNYLSKAYESGNSVDSKIGARYAAVLWKMGEKSKADQIWQKAVDLDPQNQALRDMIKKIKNSN